MNNNDTTFLQKIKDNAFYVALGLGLLAILAVIAIYTMQRDGNTYNDANIDLNQASDYSSVTTESYTNNTNRRSTGSGQRTERSTKNIDNSANMMESSKSSEEVARQYAAPTKETAVLDVVDSGEQLPVTADTGELNFGSDKILEWPIKGEVILPYSMETTVYYKTLDQYKTNPGMLIAAGSGSTVKNAYLGKVVKVTSDNTYGNVVTLYIGNDYSISYGQLDTIYVKEGDYVKAGESIGTIGKPTDSFEDEGSHLFFQLMQGDSPIDPITFMD